MGSIPVSPAILPMAIFLWYNFYMDKNKRNKIICYSTVLVLLVIFGMIISSIFSALHNLDNHKRINAYVDNTSYSPEKFAKEFNLNVREESDHMVVFNGETYFYCKFDESCSIWPDTDNGKTKWAEPLVIVTFRKE